MNSKAPHQHPATPLQGSASLLRYGLFLFIVALLLACSNSQQPQVIRVEEHGIVPGTGANSTAAINRLLEKTEGPAILKFPKGRYDFYPDSAWFRDYFESNTYDVNPKRLAILLDKKKDVIIDGQGSDFVYHGHIQPFTLDGCERVEVRNVSIDWDRPLTAEAEVLQADTGLIVLRIDTVQFPFRVHEKGVTFVGEGWEAGWRLSGGSWLIEFNRDHIIPPFTGDHGCVNGKLEEVVYSSPAPGLLHMTGHFTKTPAAGHFLVLRHSTRDHAGIFLFHSQDITLHNIRVYHTAGLGILSQYCENITMVNVDMVPNPHKNRYLSSHDDGLHFMGCRGRIIIDSCDAQGLMDDPINIHGTCVPVVDRVSDSTLLCRFAHSMSSGLRWAQPGDTVSFIERSNMNSRGVGRIRSFNPLSKDTFLLVFEQPIPEWLGASFSLENLSWTPDVSITNCFAGSCRARGYLISTPGKVVVENNIFETSGSAILIAGDANYWFESGAVTDVTIRNNEFRWPCNSSSYQFCHAVISIFPEIPEPDPGQPFHQHITIEGNSFYPADYPVLFARSVDGLRFVNNTIVRSRAYAPWHPNTHMVWLEACKQVEIAGNTLGEDVLGRDIFLRNMAASDLLLADTLLRIHTR